MSGETTTIQTCCPDAGLPVFTCLDNKLNTLPELPWHTTQKCYMDVLGPAIDVWNKNSLLTVHDVDNDELKVTSTLVRSARVNAYGIEVRHRSRDLEVSMMCLS